VPAPKLLREALAVLEQWGYELPDEERLCVVVTFADGKVELTKMVRDLKTTPIMDEPPRSATTPDNCLWLSPLEASICKVLSPDRLTPMEKIAEQSGENNSKEFRAVVRNLADRLVITAVHARGYYLGNGPAPATGRNGKTAP
jgi:hypothetical protein